MRRPVDTMAATGHANPRQTIWDELRAVAGEHLAGSVTLTALVTKTGINRKTVADYLASLAAAGYLIRDDATGAYRLAREASVHAPRVRKDGSAVTQGAGTMNLWRSMRMLTTFSALDLSSHSTTESVTVTESTAQSYCTMLSATGFLKVVQKADPHTSQKARYRLIRNDGPKPPMIQRVKQVFDPNTGKVYPKGARA